jgi:amino acid adenylation domain-containing protein
VLEQQLAYWRRQLAGAARGLDLPTDHTRPAVQGYAGAREPVVLNGALDMGVRSLGQRYGGTVFMVLLAAFDVLLARYSGQREVVVGTAVAGRTRAETAGVVGCFMNTLALRVDLGGNPRFGELVGRVREVALAAYTHQELPFEKLVETLQPERDLSRGPIVQVMFILQNTPLHDIALPGLRMELLDVERAAARFDLTLELFDTVDGLHGSLEYNTALFERETIRRMIGHLRMVLEQVVAAPDRRIGDLVLLTADEREQLAAWNATTAAYPRDQCLHMLIEAQVERTPEAIAVSFEAQQLSYRALNCRANQLAHSLRALGVGPEVAVAVYAERAIELLVGLLGVLKAGGAYVPLDPAYPPQRLAFMLADSQAPVILTQACLLGRLPQHTATALCLDADWGTIAGAPSHDPRSVVRAEQLAYVIYTSGSTGQPKGVQISHGALANFLTTMAERPGLSQADVLLSVTTIAFDIAGLELFLPLIVGARVVLTPREVALDGRRLGRLIDECGATVMQATPTTWRLLPPSSRRLRVLCGGEVLPRDLANQLVGQAAAVWNMYGPTETTIWSALAPVTAGAGPVAIGRPIANTQLHILDAALQPVPIGIPGELYIGGDGLARGYLRRPDLTAERFVPNPFADFGLPILDFGLSGPLIQNRVPPLGESKIQNGERLYRTGDLARWRADGTIEYLGRVDQQVKVRGHRIELGEIEAALGQHPNVQESVVVVREEPAGEQRLVAYVVPNDERGTINDDDSSSSLIAHRSSFTSELHTFLAAHLPGYMLPSSFVFLDSLPRTPNSKIDRRALPDPAAHAAAGARYIAPRSGLERTIGAVWQDLLGVEQVGMDDNFFELGGHSLLMMQAAHRLQDLLKRELTVIELLKYPTVSALARYLGGEQAGRVVQTEQRGQELAAGRQRLRQQLQRKRVVGDDNG